MPRPHPHVIAQLERYRREPAEVDRFLDPWLRHFRAVSDLSLRHTVLREGLEGFDDATLIAVLDRLEARALGGEAGPRGMVAELALDPDVVQELPYDRRVELYGAAREAEFTRVAARFLGVRPPAKADEPVDNPHLDLPAGVRKQAARAQQRELIDRLLHDRDPRVIRALLDNPRLVERDAVKIAALRPTAPEVLETLAAHGRWSRSYRVRKALAFNPCSPSTLARQLVPTLLEQDLRALRDTGTVAPELREEANHLLTGRARDGLRHPGGSSAPPPSPGSRSQGR
jgi:hypothetical protein